RFVGPGGRRAPKGTRTPVSANTAGHPPPGTASQRARRTVRLLNIGGEHVYFPEVAVDQAAVAARAVTTGHHRGPDGDGGRWRRRGSDVVDARRRGDGRHVRLVR